MITHNNKSVHPVIKWSGSKRKVAPELAKLIIPARRYYEPFIGSGAMLPFRHTEYAVAGDVVKELIDLWNVIRDEPKEVGAEYKKRWDKLQAQGHTAYYEVRDSFNSTRNPHDLLFLSRTCVNGLIRFNKDGGFNNSLHHSRPGVHPDSLASLIHMWSSIVKKVDFVCQDYRETLSTVQKGDMVFLDPPYIGTKGRYMPDAFSAEDLYDELERLNKIGAYWILTYDGTAGDREYKVSIPAELYETKVGVHTGNSPFTKLMGTSLDAVTESVYLNYQPAGELLHQFRDKRHEKSGLLVPNLQV